MKTFEKIENNSYSFSNCDACDARCCDGSRGSTYAQITLEDFEHIGKHFPILFTKGEYEYLMPVVLLSNGNGHCKYIQDNKCMIYNERPSICKLYPLSPYVTNEVYIDVTCPAVIKDENNTTSNSFSYARPSQQIQNAKEHIQEIDKTIMIEKGKIQEAFHHEKLDDYQSSIIETYNHFKTYNYEANLEIFAVIRNMIFYSFKEDVKDEYVQQHLETLKHFDAYYQT